MLERGMAFDREDIDLDAKPAWLNDVSPNGQVPVLKAESGEWLFESGAISRYLDTISGGTLTPGDPLDQARHAAWIGHADAMLGIVARIVYGDADAAAMDRSLAALVTRLAVLRERFPPDPFFAGPAFGLCDAVFATLFRKLPVLDRLPGADLAGAAGVEIRAWWKMVKDRPSVSAAAPKRFEMEFADFIAAKNSHAGRQMARALS